MNFNTLYSVIIFVQNNKKKYMDTEINLWLPRFFYANKTSKVGQGQGNKNIETANYCKLLLTNVKDNCSYHVTVHIKGRTKLREVHIVQ